MSPLEAALREAFEEVRVADVDEEPSVFLETLFKAGFIVVGNTEPSEHGFNCHVCGCSYGGHLSKTNPSTAKPPAAHLKMLEDTLAKGWIRRVGEGYEITDEGHAYTMQLIRERAQLGG